MTEFYLQSHDFNGIPSVELLRRCELTPDKARPALRELLEGELITFEFGRRFENPHIKALPPADLAAQLSEFDSNDCQTACAYPAPKHLEAVVDKASFAGRPFTLRLTLGEPQLSYLSFDLSVLESYRNDPRYHYDCSDIDGRICVKDEYYKTDKMKEADQVLLQTFGFSYDEGLNRAVAVFLRYLAGLSPEHQQIWESKRLTREDNLHPDYARSSFGEWPEKESIFIAYLEEIHHINEMCKRIGWVPLFNKEILPHDKPREFGFLIRPTAKEFHDFVLLLDKLTSDNLNREFFKGKIPVDQERELGGGRISVQPKGTITLLEEWVRSSIRMPDPAPFDEAIAGLRKVRKLRQAPAHRLEDNTFDQKYFHEQRELIREAYVAVRIIRLLLANHPRAKHYKIPDWLFEGKIWSL